MSRFSWLLFMVLGIIWISAKQLLRPKRYNRLPRTGHVCKHLKDLFAEEVSGRDTEGLNSAKDWQHMLAYCHARVVGAQHSVIPWFRSLNVVSDNQSHSV